MVQVFDKRRCAVTEEEVKQWHDAVESAIADMKTYAEGSILEALGNSVATSRLATHAIQGARSLVEEETLSLVDTMDIAFGETNGALKKLRETNKTLSEESAFIVSSLGGIQRKTVEVSEYAAQLERLNAAFDKFKGHLDSGLFDMAAKCAKAIEG